MVNRNEFNRKKVKRLKSIRDKKKARINRKKAHLGFKEAQEAKPLTKKETKRQKRLDQIYKQLNTSYNDVFSKNRKRRNKNKQKNQNNDKSEKMEVEQ